MKKWFSLLAVMLFSNSVFATAALEKDYNASEIIAYKLATEQLGPSFSMTEELMNLLALAINPSKTLLYVADQAAGIINIYDLSTGEKLNTFLSDIALSSDGNILYVSNFNGFNVTIYNSTATAQLGVSPVVTGVGTAAAVALGFYVRNPEDNSAPAFDSSTSIPTDSPLPITQDIGSPLPMTQDIGSSLPITQGMNSSFQFTQDMNSSFQFIQDMNLSFQITQDIGLPFSMTQNITFPETFIAFVLSPIPSPTNLSGYQKKEDFGLEYELLNRLSWIASPSASGYYVYRNGVKIATLGASTLSYTDHNRKKKAPTVYSVTAFDQLGTESSAIICIIN